MDGFVPAGAMLAEATGIEPGPAVQRDKPLKILFLHPKTLVDSWPIPVDTLGEMVKMPSSVYPILASVISDLPVDYEIFDGYVARESFRNYKKRLSRPDLICISVMTSLKAADTEMSIRLARSLNPGVKIILGGNHASAWPERWLQAGADYVIIKEGEIPFRQLIQALTGDSVALSSIPNLRWRDADGLHKSSTQLPLMDLNQTPMPDWSRFDFRPYGMGMSDGFAAAVEISRGCPQRCDFCNINKFWDYKQRYKSVERVMQELESLHARGVREFIFTDDNFGGDHRHTVKLLEAMISKGLNMRFGSFLRGDTVAKNPGFAEMAAKAGMRFCMMGIESLDPAWLKSHRKGVRSADVVGMYADVYRRLNTNGIYVVGLFISPAQGESTDFSGTGACGVVCDYHYSANLIAQKGSQMYEDYLARNAVGKDMFYHDWNLSSIVLEDGKIQKNQKSLFDEVKETLTGYGIRSALFGTKFARRFRWRPIFVVAERLLCTTSGDLRRWRLAKDTSLSLQERQDRMIESVLGTGRIEKLVRRRFWISPLSLRTGLWSSRPRRAKLPSEVQR
jgi:anaerobic magnesium-protoporphyrin IX monomethyl ester cyclase